MKLSEVSSYISKEIGFPAAVTSYLTPQEWQLDDDLELKGGFVKDAQYAWLAYGPNFQVIRTSNCAKVAAWTFGASLRNQRTKIVCVTELPCSDGSSRVPHFVVGLALEPDMGMVCVFDVRGSKILRAIKMPAMVTSLSVVDSGCGGCYPLPQLLSSMNGILAVGLAGGQVLLIDLCHINCDEGMSMEASNVGDICDELHPADLIYINNRERDPQTLECKRSYAATTGGHLCSVLNDDFLSEQVFSLPARFRDGRSMQRSEVDVTAVLYIPQIASLVVGFNFGCFQIWNLTRLAFVFMSPMLQNEKEIAALAFQEPCDDPCNYCYLWAVYGNKECNRYSFPFAIMYALCYKTKEWIDAYGFLYQDFSSCVQRFDLDLVGEEGMVGGQIVACHTISKLISSTNQKDGLQNELDEPIQEADLTLALFAWQTWGTNNKTSHKMAIFDLNQWYKEQMPGRISQGITSGQVASYMALFSLENAQAKPLLDVNINAESISQFTAVQSLEEHFYPWSLAFDSCSLFADRITVMNHPGVQRDMLSHLEKSGPACFLQPTETFLQCVSMGLKPIYVDVSCLPMWTTAEQREFLLSVALEYQLVGLLSRCATEWADGSQSVLGCTLSTFLKWGWKRATVLKSHADSLCIPLYDFSGISLDTNSCKLLDYCGNQLHHLSSLFHGVLKMCRNPIITGVGDISQQAEVLELVATYLEVVEWFMNAHLLPECPPDECEGTAVEKEQLRVPYPVADLAKLYQDRREELKQLRGFSGEMDNVLFIDRLVKEECGEALTSLWQMDGGSGLYPPPSIQSLLRIYLLDGIPMHIKHSIIIYVFLDLSKHFENSPRYDGTVRQFINFPSAFRLTPSVIKITQSLWLLDHRKFLTAIDGLLDPLVSMDDLKPWQHQCIIKAFLYQGQQQLALSYIRVQQPPLRDIEDIRLNLTVLLVNGLVFEAFQFQRQHSNDMNSSELLSHFFSICQRINQLGLVLQLPLTPIEEDAFINFLQNCQNSLADDMRVMYYLERSRIAEAMHVNDTIRNRRHKLELNPLKRSRTDEGSNCVRDTIVKAYAKTLPSVTKKLAEHCVQQKSSLSNWKQIARPTPMSVDVHRGEFQPVQYKSSLLQATLQKARETWNQMIQPPAPPSTLANQNESDMLETVPFLCTPRAPSEAFCFPRDMTPVIFPTLKKPTPKGEEDDDFMESYPLKRFRYTESFSSAQSPVHPSVKNAETEEDTDALSLLHTPHVRRRTPSSIAREQEIQNSLDVFTPQSILKVSKLVQSASPRNAYEESVASGSGSTSDTADDILSKPESRSTPSLSARQIRFSFPTERPSSRSTSSEGSPEISDGASKVYWAESRFIRRDRSSTYTPPEIHSRLSLHKRVDKSAAVEEEMEPGIGDMLEEEMNFTLTLSQYYKRQQALSKAAEVSAKQKVEIQHSIEEQQDESDSSVCLEDGEDTFHSVDSSYHAADDLNRSAVQKEETKGEAEPEKNDTSEPMEQGSENEVSVEEIPIVEKTPESKLKRSSPEMAESHILHSGSDDEHQSSLEVEDQVSNTSASDSVCEIKDHEGNSNNADDSVRIIEDYEKSYEESQILPSSSDGFNSSFFEVSNTLEVSESELDNEICEMKEGEGSEVTDSDGVECLEVESKQYEELRPVAVVMERNRGEREGDDVHSVDTDEEGHEVLVHDRPMQEGLYLEQEDSTSSEDGSVHAVTEDDIGYGHEEHNEDLFEEERPVQQLGLGSEAFTSRVGYFGKYNSPEEQGLQESNDQIETPDDNEEDSIDISISVKPVGSSGGSIDTTQETMIKSELKELVAETVQVSSDEVEITEKQNVEISHSASIHEMEVQTNTTSEVTANEGSSEKTLEANAVIASNFEASALTDDTENQVVKRTTKRASSLQPKDSSSYQSKQKSRASSVEPRLCSHTQIKTKLQTDVQKNLLHSDNNQSDRQRKVIADNLRRSNTYSKRRASSVQPTGTCKEEKVGERRRSSRRASSLAPESIGSSQTSNYDPQLPIKTAVVVLSRIGSLKADSQHDAENVTTQDYGNNRQKVTDPASSAVTEVLSENTPYSSTAKRKRRSSSLQPEYVHSLDRKSRRRSSSLQPESQGKNKTHFPVKIKKELEDSPDVQNEASDSAEIHIKADFVPEPGTSGSPKPAEIMLKRQRFTRSRRSGSLQPQALLVTESKEKETRWRRSTSLQPQSYSELQEMDRKKLQVKLEEESTDSGESVHIRRRSARFITSLHDSEDRSKRSSSLQPEASIVTQADGLERKGRETNRRRSSSLQPEAFATQADGLEIKGKETKRRRSSSLQPEALIVTQADGLERKEKETNRRRSSSLQPEALIVTQADGLERKEKETNRRRSSSLQPEALIVTQADGLERKGRETNRRRSSSLQPEAFTTQADGLERKGKETNRRRSSSLQPEALKVTQADELERKGKETNRRRSRSLQPELQEMDTKVKVKMEEDSGEEISTKHRSGILLAPAENESEVHMADDEDRSSTVSSNASTIKREDLYTHIVLRKKRTSSTDSSVSTVRYDEQFSPGKENKTETTKSSKVLGDTETLGKVSDATKHPIRSGDKASSVHGDNNTRAENTDFKRLRRSCSVPPVVISDTVRGVNIPPSTSKEQESVTEATRSHKEMEEYTTARRLTRHQRSLLQRSLELAKTSHSYRERRISKLPPVPESSDQEDADSETLSQASSTATRSSARLRSQAALSPTSSQESPKQKAYSESTRRRSARHTRPSSSGSVDADPMHHSEGSPHSMKSEDSAFTSSVNRSSPLSTQSEEPSAGRRRSLRSRLRTSAGSDIIEMRPRKNNAQDSDSSDREGSVASSVVSSQSSLRSRRSQSTSLHEGEIRRSSRISQLQQEPFEFSPPTIVLDKAKKEVLSSAPDFVFSPPATREIIKGQSTSQPVRAHRMSLRGLHTIAEESSSSISPTNSEGSSTKGSPKKAKRLKTSESARGQEKQATESKLSPGGTVSKKPKHYGVFKQRKIFYLRKKKAKKQSPS